MPTKKLTAEERAALLDSREERARKTIEKARAREKKLRIDKKINIHSFLEEVTGIDDISLADFLRILDQTCLIQQKDGAIKPHTVRDIIRTKSAALIKSQEQQMTCKQQQTESKTSIPESRNSSNGSRERNANSLGSTVGNVAPTA